MAAIQGNMAAAMGGGDPASLMDTLRNSPTAQQFVSQYMPQHIRQNLFMPEPGTDTFMGRHPAFAHSLENAMVGLSSMDQVPQTTGQGISMVAKSLMAGPMAHRQWQMQQAMMPFSIANQMSEIQKNLSEAYEHQSKGDYFGDHGDYYRRGAGAGNTTQTRIYNNVTPVQATDGKMYTPGTQLPEGVKFVPKGNQTGPWGGSLLGRIISGMQGQSPDQTSGQLTDEEKMMRQGLAHDAWNKVLDSYKAGAAARNFAPGAMDPHDKFLGEVVGKISDQRVTEASQQISRLQGKDYITMVPSGVQDSEAWRQQQITQLQQGILGEQQQRMQSILTHDYHAYSGEIQKGIVNGTYTPPTDASPMSPALGAPNLAAPNQGMTGATQPGTSNLSPAATSYWNTIAPQTNH